MHATDHELLLQIAKRDRAAFGEFYDRYAARMLGLIRGILPDHAREEDVLQEVFWQVWQKASAFDPAIASPSAWLMMMTRARAIDQVRRTAVWERYVGRAQELNQPKAYSNGHAASQVNDDESASARAALAALPAEQFEAISLAYHGGLTCAQIAEVRGLPLGTVKTRIRQGLMKLRQACGVHAEVNHP